MKICLKERGTGLWLMTSGKWETNKRDAQCFDCGADAIHRAELERPLDVQVCFEAEDPDLSFELGRERGEFLPGMGRPYGNSSVTPT